MFGRLKFGGKKDSTEEITSAIKTIQDGIENTDTFQKVKNDLQNLCNSISTKESVIPVNNTSVVANVGSANVSNANVGSANVGSANVGSNGSTGSTGSNGSNPTTQYGGKRKTKKRSRRSKSKTVLTVSYKTRKNRKSSNRTRKISRKIKKKKRSQQSRKSKKVPLTKRQIQLNIIARYYKKKYQNSKAQKRRYRRNVNLKKYVKQKSSYRKGKMKSKK